MKIFNPTLVGEAQSQSSSAAPPEPASVHSHSNLAILSGLSLDEHGVLLFDGKPIDTVGQQFVNAAILEQFTIERGKLYFAGQPVDTVGSVFSNDAVLRMFSQDAQGNLLFNGQPIKAGTEFANAEVLARLGVSADGKLTLDGNVISGSGGSSSLTVTKLGGGVALVKDVVADSIQTRSLVAGSNVTIDVSGDEVKINATLSGAVNSASSFKASDGYTNSRVISNPAASQLQFTEAVAETGLLFLARLGADSKASLKDTALPLTGTVTPNTAVSALASGIGTLFANGKLSIPNGTTYSDTSPATWFAGTVDWTIEFDFIRDTSKLGTAPQHIVSGWNASFAQSNMWVGIDASNKIYVTVGIGTGYVTFTSTIAITDASKHHLEVNRSGGVLRLFIDGVLDSSTALTGSVNAGTGFCLGNSIDGVAPFCGYLRDVKVYNYAKHTAAYTVPRYYADKVATTNTLTMASKMLASTFWKQVTSMTVNSTETATAYLKWLLLDANGAWYWDTTNKVWAAATVANILTQGMTTTALTSAMANNAWNYRSDTIGFCVAFVTTDGTTPILTSIQIAAVQSADKTAGHAVLDGTGAAMSQRTQLKFVNCTVTDDGSSTVVAAPKDTSQLLHKGSSLDTVVSDLVTNKGLVGGKAVDVSSGLADGTVLAYSLTADKFKPAVPAVGANGQGMFKTAPFAIAAGEEVTVTHQQVNDGRAVYQVDQVVAGSQSATTYRALLDSEKTLTGLQESIATEANHRIQLPTTFSTIVKGSTATFPVATCIGISYVVDDYLYVIPGATTNWAGLTTIYRAPLTAPTTFTAVGNTPAALSSSNGYQVYRYKDKLYIPQVSSVYVASIDNPAVWSVAGALPVSIIQGAAFVVGTRMYIVGGQIGSTYAPVSNIYSADMSDLNTWRAETAFPVALGRMSCYQYGDYLYILGGETAFDSTYSNKIYRAHKDTPTTWTQIGTLPQTLGSVDEPVVYNGRVFIIGGRINASTYSGAVYSADASNPVSWTTHTDMTTTRQFATKALVEDAIVIIGGFNGSWLSSIETYALTKTVTSGAQGDCTLAAINTSLLQKIVRFEVDAFIPTNALVYAAVAFDGVWNYYNTTTSAWVPCADKATALAAAKSLQLNTGNLFYVQGLENFALGSIKSIQVALRLTNSAANVTPILRKYALTGVGIDSYEVLLVGKSSYADVSVRHAQGTYTQSLVKNKTASAMNVVVKVCDGHITP